jgi:hypothetical protein
MENHIRNVWQEVVWCQVEKGDSCELEVYLGPESLMIAAMSLKKIKMNVTA